LPGHAVHNLIDRLYLDRDFPKLHRAMDKAVFYLGADHRCLFHDLPSACFIASKLYPNDPRALWSAHLHIYYDELCTQDPSYRRSLERMAKLDKQKKKRRRRKREKRKKWDNLESLLRLIKLLRPRTYSEDPTHREWLELMACLKETKKRRRGRRARRKKRKEKDTILTFEMNIIWI
jgi:hypothetical protein